MSLYLKYEKEVDLRFERRTCYILQSHINMTILCRVSPAFLNSSLKEIAFV